MINFAGPCLIPHSALLFLVALFAVMVVAQTVVFGFKMLQLDRATQRLSLVVEAGLVVFLLLNLMFCWALANSYSAPYVGILFGWINISPAFWLVLPFALACFAAAITEKHLHYLADGIFTLVIVPFFLNEQDAFWCCAYALCAVYFLGRTTFTMIQVWTNRKKHLSYFASIEAMNNLPEGILAYDKQGNIELLNDSMRNCLSSLLLSTDLADARVIAGTLWARGNQFEADVQRPNRCVKMDMPNDTACLFVFETVEVKGQPHELVIALDITEEERLRRSTEETNRELRTTQEELRNSLENVQIVAENDALLYLHSRVHDIIGQRLSILHRYLEDGAQSEESFAQIRPLLNSILDDLENDEANDSKAELYAIAYAFSLIDVKVQVDGLLPLDPVVSAAFVQVIREACTNAVKHAQASNIWVTLAETNEAHILTVSNDGEAFSGELRQGKGLPGMARAIVSAGGQLSLQTEENFTLCATVPRMSAN